MSVFQRAGPIQLPQLKPIPDQLKQFLVRVKTCQTLAFVRKLNAEEASLRQSELNFLAQEDYYHSGSRW